nr:hypothetical protein [Mucilaginibacter sp. X5P1]
MLNILEPFTTSFLYNRRGDLLATSYNYTL